MTIMLNLIEYQRVKTEYIKYLEVGEVDEISLVYFKRYKYQLNADADVKAVSEKHKHFICWLKNIESTLRNMKIKGCINVIKLIQNSRVLTKTEKQLLTNKIYNYKDNRKRIETARVNQKTKKTKKKTKNNEPKIFISSIYCDTYGSKAINNFRRK